MRPGQVALAWLLAQSWNIIPIPGSTDPGHVMMNAGAAHLTLSPQDLQQLAGQQPAALDGEDTAAEIE